MDLKKFIIEQELQNVPVGLGGCRCTGNYFECCPHDIFVFESGKDKIVKFNDEILTIHYSSLSETNSRKLLEFENLKIIQDPSWDLKIFLSKINQKAPSLFESNAKSCLLDSLFCSHRVKMAIKEPNPYAFCWQKCAAYYLADAISLLNHKQIQPSHMLDSLRKFKKNSFNEHISTIMQTVGIERAAPTLLERMLKSTIGFSDIVEENKSEIISQKHDFFVKHSMFADCYFYLEYLNKYNFMKIKDRLTQMPDLIYILKTAFDVQTDENILLQNNALVQDSCNALLESISTK